MNRTVPLFVSLFAIAIISFAIVYSYENYFGAKPVTQTNREDLI